MAVPSSTPEDFRVGDQATPTTLWVAPSDPPTLVCPNCRHQVPGRSIDSIEFLHSWLHAPFRSDDGQRPRRVASDYVRTPEASHRSRRFKDGKLMAKDAPTLRIPPRQCRRYQCGPRKAGSRRKGDYRVACVRATRFQVSSPPVHWPLASFRVSLSFRTGDDV